MKISSKITCAAQRIHSPAAAIKLLINLVQASASPQLLIQRTATAAHSSAETRRAASLKSASTEPDAEEADLRARSGSIAPPGGSLCSLQVFVPGSCRLAERLISVRGASVIPSSLLLRLRPSSVSPSL